MLKKAILNPSIYFNDIDDEIEALSDEVQIRISSPLLKDIIRHMKNNSVILDIADELSGKYPLYELEYGVNILLEKRLIVDKEFLALAANHSLILDPRIPNPKNIIGGVTILADKSKNDAYNALRSNLQAAGISVFDEIRPNSSLVVVCVRDFISAEAVKYASSLTVSNIPWLPWSTRGSANMAGPIFTREVNRPCFDCMTYRLKQNSKLKNESIAFHHLEAGYMSQNSSNFFVISTLSGILSCEITKLLFTGTSTLVQNMIRFDGVSCELSHHVVYKRPQCHDCGDRTKTIPDISRGLNRTPSFAIETGGNGYRSAKAEDVIARFGRHVDRLTGIITDLRSLPENSTSPVKNFYAAHYYPERDSSRSLVRKSTYGSSGGKGKTELEARVGALCEGLERYSTIWDGGEPVIRASYANLGPEKIHPSSITLYSDEQYKNRDYFNCLKSHFSMVPKKFDENAIIDWTAVWSLTKGQTRFVPSGLCFYGHPGDDDGPYYFADSNGTAAGHTLDEAILQAIFELIERDAIAIWWYNRLKLPEIDLSTCDSQYIDQMRSFYKSIGREFWVLDATSDLGVPVCAAISYNIKNDRHEITLGFGAHTDPQIALYRALTEMNQFIPTILNKHNNENIYRYASKEVVEWLSIARLEQEEYLRPTKNALDLRKFPYNQSEKDISKILDTAVRELATRNLEVFVLDLTRPDIKLNVVKVFCPGLRHFWRRLAPGRLFDVPLSTGRACTKTMEPELNPWTLFF